jgi:hypothetical protein
MPVTPWSSGGSTGRRRIAPRLLTGLRGLADRVAALDGRLDVDSAPGIGTTVRALIPCRVEISPEPTNDSPRHEPDGRRETQASGT